MKIEKTIDQELVGMGSDPICEMANLSSDQTGVQGIIFISTQMARHGPRVKFFIKAGRDQSSFSVSIDDIPEVKACSKGFERYANTFGPKVIEFVTLNQTALLAFWNDGDTWTNKQVQTMINSLRHVS